MNGGGKGLLVAASFAAAGCAAAPNAVEIRPIANPGTNLRPGSDRLADAKGQLALGNIGLALEGFRNAARDYPDNAEAFAGMAACYEAMRRYDLAELKYQAALALAPHNPALLAKLAAALDQEGKADAAAEVRSEIAEIQSASAALDQAEADPMVLPAAASLAPAQTVTVAIPAPKSVASRSVALSAAPAQVAERPPIPAPNLAATQQVNVLVGVAPRLHPISVGQLAPVITAPAEPVPAMIPGPRLTDRTKINVVAGLSPRLKPILVGQLAPVMAVPAEPVPAMIPAPRLADQANVNVVAGLATQIGPRLERMSLGEVALLTSGEPVWRGQVVARTPQKLTVRWVPVTMAAVRPNIRLLNAARVQGLAARNRSYLLDRGWRKIEIGDATETRERSIVLYPAMRPMLGRSLAAQFGFRAQPTDSSQVLVVLLGRDAAALRAAPTRG
ncbi:MAG TPA: LytR C-terminal domain-containing protein [Sphingomicrobium sp.]